MQAPRPILVIEPYLGGSHQAFIEELGRRLPCPVELLSLPARKWKWRMRLAAPYFAEQLRGSGNRDFRCILASSYLDAASFRGLAPSWTREIPLVVYFHENQFVYPVQEEQERDYHFALTNFTTALAADSILFNSRHNLETFLEGCAILVRRSGDMRRAADVAALREKARVLPPVLDFSSLDEVRGKRGGEAGQSPVIVWNHRWEHDKDPEFFFKVLLRLAGEGVAFRLVVLGQAFRETPEIFEQARRMLSDRILHFGYVANRQDYARLLATGDIVVSTARHEFFGMSVLEAVRAGCRPVLPRRLSYPELFPAEFLYDDNSLHERLLEAMCRGRLSRKESLSLTRPFTWEALEPAYNLALGLHDSGGV